LRLCINDSGKQADEILQYVKWDHLALYELRVTGMMLAACDEVCQNISRQSLAAQFRSSRSADSTAISAACRQVKEVLSSQETAYSACTAVVQTFRDFSSNRSVSWNACYAIGQVRDDHTKSALIAAGALAAVVQAMSTHDGDKDVVCLACAAIACLAVNNKCNADIMTAAKRVCETVVQALGHLDDTQPINLLILCDAVRDLLKCGTTLTTKLRDVGVFGALVTALSTHLNNSDVVQTGCSAIYSLVTGNTVVKLRFKDAGVEDFLTRVLEAYPNLKEMWEVQCLREWYT
jgi:hypothetical protein